MIRHAGRATACRRHRSALLDAAEGEDIDRGDPAWQHLEWCFGCRREVEQSVQTIVALRRLGKEVARTEPSGEAWPRLRDRMRRQRPAERWRPQLSLGGLAVAAALVAMLSVPSTLTTSPAGGFEESSPPAAISRQADTIERRVEERWLLVRPFGAADASLSDTTGFVFDQRRFGETILEPPTAAPQAKLQ